MYDEGHTMEPPRMDPLTIIVSAFALGSFGGLAALLRSRKELTWRNIFSAVLYSGMIATATALLWFEYFSSRGNTLFVLGISALAGIGGATLVDFAMQIRKAGGLKIIISPKGEGDE